MPSRDKKEAEGVLSWAAKQQKPGRIANIYTTKKGVSKCWKPMNTEEERCRLLSNTAVNYDFHDKHRTDHLDGKVLKTSTWAVETNWTLEIHEKDCVFEDNMICSSQQQTYVCQSQVMSSRPNPVIIHGREVKTYTVHSWSLRYETRKISLSIGNTARH